MAYKVSECSALLLWIILPVWDNSDTCGVALLNLEDFCNPSGFSSLDFFLWERRFRGYASDTVQVGGRSFMYWDSDQGVLAVPLQLHPCEAESGSPLPQNNHNSPNALFWLPALSHLPTYSTRSFQCCQGSGLLITAKVNLWWTLIFFSMLLRTSQRQGSWDTDKLPTTSQGRNYLLRHQLINQKEDEVQRKNYFNYHLVCFTIILEIAGHRCYMNVIADFR